MFSLDLLQNLSLAALCGLALTEQRRIFQITGSCQHYRSCLIDKVWLCDIIYKPAMRGEGDCEVLAYHTTNKCCIAFT